MENKVLWHYKSPNQKELIEALNQLKQNKMRNLFINELVKQARKKKNRFACWRPWL